MNRDRPGVIGLRWSGRVVGAPAMHQIERPGGLTGLLGAREIPLFIAGIFNTS